MDPVVGSDAFCFHHKGGTVQAVQSNDTGVESCNDQRRGEREEEEVEHRQGIQYCFIDALYCPKEQGQLLMDSSILEFEFICTKLCIHGGMQG